MSKCIHQLKLDVNSRKTDISLPTMSFVLDSLYFLFKWILDGLLWLTCQGFCFWCDWQCEKVFSSFFLLCFIVNGCAWIGRDNWMMIKMIINYVFGVFKIGHFLPSVFFFIFIKFNLLLLKTKPIFIIQIELGIFNYSADFQLI